jgi:hypothetical protein
MILCEGSQEKFSEAPVTIELAESTRVMLDQIPRQLLLNEPAADAQGEFEDRRAARSFWMGLYRARPAASATCTLRCSSGGGTGLKSSAVMPRRRQRA